MVLRRPSRLEAALGEAGAEARVVALRVEGTAEGTHLAERILLQRGGAQVDAGPERTRTIGAGAHAALQLHVLHAAGQVGHVHPEHGLALGVVDGHAVHGDVDARGIGAAHAMPV